MTKLFELMGNRHKNRKLEKRTQKRLAVSSHFLGYIAAWAAGAMNKNPNISAYIRAIPGNTIWKRFTIHPKIFSKTFQPKKYQRNVTTFVKIYPQKPPAKPFLNKKKLGESNPPLFMSWGHSVIATKPIRPRRPIEIMAHSWEHPQATRKYDPRTYLPNLVFGKRNLKVCSS